MTTTEQDARALTYLAGRLRDDTPGANRWDQPGIEAEVARLVGQNLHISIERVIRHAADPDAHTPGAIRRPWTPEPPGPVRELEHLAPHERCRICSKPQARCTANPWGGHMFEPDIRQPSDVDLAPLVAELKGRLHPEPNPPHAEEATL